MEITFSGPLAQPVEAVLQPTRQFLKSRGVSLLVNARLLNHEEQDVKIWKKEVPIDDVFIDLVDVGEVLSEMTLVFICVHEQSKTLYTPTVQQEGHEDIPTPLESIRIDLSCHSEENYVLVNRSLGWGVLPQTAQENGIFWYGILVGILAISAYFFFFSK